MFYMGTCFTKYKSFIIVLSLNLALNSCGVKLNARKKSTLDYHQSIDGVRKYVGHNLPIPKITDPDIKAGIALYTQHCAGCHGDITKSTKKDRSSEQIANSIAQIAEMKFLKPILQDKQIILIAKALDSRIIFPAPPEALNVYALQLMNRHMISDKFRHIFFSSVAEIETIISANISMQPVMFGGLCTVNHRNCAWVRGTDGSFGFQVNVDGIRSTAPGVSFLGSVNIVREGYLFKTCEQIIAKNSTTSGLLSRLNIDIQSNAATNADVEKITRVMFSGRKASEEVNLAAIALFSEAKAKGLDSLSAWKLLVLGFCQSSMIEVF